MKHVMRCDQDGTVARRGAPARDAEYPSEEPVAKEGWRVRARRSLLAWTNAVAARARQLLLAAMDAGIACLERLRERARGAEQADERRDRERPGRRATTVRARDKPAAAEAVAPKPRRRLRGLLVYLGVMLAGGMGGMALAYDLLAQLLDHRSAEVKRQELKLSKYSKSAAELRKRLDQQQAKQSEAKARLAAALAENEAKLGELQAKQADAESRLARALAARTSSPQRPEDSGSSRGAARSGQAGWTRSGNCTVGKGSVRSALKGCIADMDRR